MARASQLYVGLCLAPLCPPSILVGALAAAWGEELCPITGGPLRFRDARPPEGGGQDGTVVLAGCLQHGCCLGGGLWHTHGQGEPALPAQPCSSSHPGPQHLAWAPEFHIISDHFQRPGQDVELPPSATGHIWSMLLQGAGGRWRSCGGLPGGAAFPPTSAQLPPAWSAPGQREVGLGPWEGTETHAPTSQGPWASP